jgi:ABC-type transport system involved in multi-copper enzyme maturation permease subunit
MPGFTDGLRLLALFMGPLAAILLGAEAGAGDHAAGVFRDLVVTGRSRLALFATRVPAALALCWAVMLGGFALLLIGTFAFASNLPTPGGTLILEALGFTLLATGVVCAIAVGFASLTTSRPAAITALIGWQLVASPLIANIESLGNARDAVLSQALAHFSPVALRHGHMGDVTMSTGTAILMVVAWLAVFLALGAWRTRRMDA